MIYIKVPIAADSEHCHDCEHVRSKSKGGYSIHVCDIFHKPLPWDRKIFTDKRCKACKEAEIKPDSNSNATEANHE